MGCSKVRMKTLPGSWHFPSTKNGQIEAARAELKTLLPSSPATMGNVYQKRMSPRSRRHAPWQLTSFVCLLDETGTPFCTSSGLSSAGWDVKGNPRNPQIALPGAGTWCIKIKRRRLRYMKLQKRRGCFKVRERLMLSLNWLMSCYSNVVCIPLHIIFSIINFINYFSTTLLWSKIKILVFQISNVKKLFFF